MTQTYFAALISAFALGAIAFGCANGTGAGGGTSSSCLASFVQPETTGAEVGFLDATTEVAQSFKLSAATSPANIQLKLKPIGTPTGTMTVKIEGDSSGQPNNVPLETATLDAATIKPTSATGDTGERFYTFTFPVPAAALTAGTLYWIRVKGSTAFTGTNGVNWMGNNTSAYSASGTAVSSNNGTTFTAGVIGATRAFFYELGC